MGILVQRSCYTAPASSEYPTDNTNNEILPDGLQNKSSSSHPRPNDEFIQRREQELEDVLDLVQCISFAVASDPDLFSENDELRKTLEKATNMFFSPNFDKVRTNRVFRKVAQNILIRGTHNTSHAAGETRVSDEQLTWYVQYQRISKRGREFLTRNFPQLRPETMVDWTWKKYNGIAHTLKSTELQRKGVHVLQIAQAKQDLGLPGKWDLSSTEEEDINEGLRYEDHRLLDAYCDSRLNLSYQLRDNDLVIIRAADQNLRSNALSPRLRTLSSRYTRFTLWMIVQTLFCIRESSLVSLKESIW